MALFFPAAIWIDGNPLTDQGREPVSINRDERMVALELASGKRKRYVKAVKNTFGMNWDWLPDDEFDTIDGGWARQKMKQFIGESPDVHTLRFYDRNAGWQEYVVFTNGYSEELIRRDPHTGTHFWKVSIDFEEQ
jgi:hypothetical protein